METKFLKPAAGMLVRLEGASRHLVAEGENVTMTAYWRRRLRDGDVTEAKPKPSKESLTDADGRHLQSARFSATELAKTKRNMVKS